MKLIAHDNTVETNIESKSKNFGIADMSKILGVLRNYMYQHKVRTMVQEYMSNGRDAQREAKSKRPIVVSIPNTFSPVFKVRDFGPGITPDRMSNIFLFYGATTKQDTNTQTGGFGLGAKSAFAYTDSFTIVSITNGKRRTYVAHLGANKQGSMDLISTENTDEENGTEIQVAVKPNDLHEFKKSIFRACHFWSDSEYPEFKGAAATDLPARRKEGLRVGDLELSRSSDVDYLGFNYYQKVVLIIDGIPYPIENNLAESTSLNKILNIAKSEKVFVHIGNGVIEVAASREHVADSEFTRKALDTLGKNLRAELDSYILSKFKAVKSNADWLKTYHSLNPMVNVDQHSKYGDYKIERSAINSELFQKVHVLAVTKRHGRRRSGLKIDRDPVKFINVDMVDSLYYDDTNGSSIVSQNSRILDYLNKQSKNGVVLISAYSGAAVKADDGTLHLPKFGPKDSQAALKQLIKDFDAKPLSSLPYTAPVREARAKKDRTKEMFTIHEFYTRHEWGARHSGHKRLNTTTIANVEAKKELYLYANLKDYEILCAEFTDMSNFLGTNVGGGYTLAFLSEESIQLVKNHTNFKAYSEWKSKFKPTVKVFDAAKSQIGKNHKTMQFLAKAANKIEDELVSKMVKEYKSWTYSAEIPKTIMEIVEKDIKDFADNDKKLTALIAKSYPLLTLVADSSEYDLQISGCDRNEVVKYLNLKREA